MWGLHYCFKSRTQDSTCFLFLFVCLFAQIQVYKGIGILVVFVNENSWVSHIFFIQYMWDCMSVMCLVYVGRDAGEAVVFIDTVHMFCLYQWDRESWGRLMASADVSPTWTALITPKPDSEREKDKWGRKVLELQAKHAKIGWKTLLWQLKMNLLRPMDAILEVASLFTITHEACYTILLLFGQPSPGDSKFGKNQGQHSNPVNIQQYKHPC